jgi:hypothetical protein
MQIKIFHRDIVAAFAGQEASGPFVHVANFESDHEDLADALEAAYHASNNIHGSWSRGPSFPDGEVNGDYSPAIERIAPLPVLDGKVYGLRSSSVGDLFQIGDAFHEVAGMGFKPADPAALGYVLPAEA